MWKRWISLILCAVLVMTMAVPVYALPSGMGSYIIEESEPNDVMSSSYGKPNQIASGNTVKGSLWYYPELDVMDILDCFEFSVTQNCRANVCVVTEYDVDEYGLPFTVTLQQSGTEIVKDNTASASGDSSYPYSYTLEAALEPGTYRLDLSSHSYYGNDYMLYLSMDVCTHPNASEVVVNPTCTTQGYTNYICPDCHTTTQGNYTPELGHEEVPVAGMDATCTEAGLTEGSACSRCGEIFTQQQTIPQKEHIWGGWRIEKQATCGEDGSRTRTCFLGKESETEVIPATGEHSFGDWAVEKAPTCGEDGTNIRTCSGCGKTETEVIPATGEHSFGDWTVEKAPTCVNDGTNIRTCSGCGATETQTVPMTGEHNYADTELTLIKAPDRYDTGLLSGRKCMDCGETISETLPTVTDSCYTVPDGVVRIGERAFYSGRQFFTAVILPDSVTHIEKEAFAYCYLSQVTFGNGLVSIGPRAFYSNNLKSIILPDSLTTIGYEAFDGNRNLTSVTFGKGLTSIGDHAFSSCGLTSLTLPESLAEIGHYAFAYCDSLAGLTLPDTLTEISQSMFYSCDSLTSLTFPDSLAKIDPDAFYNCISLTDVTFGDGPISIGSDAFYSCPKLASITFGDGDTSIGENAFYNCKGLTEITFGNGDTTVYDNSFHSCENLAEITFGNGETVLKHGSFGTFCYCPSLKNVTFGDGLTSISSEAFRNCDNLASVTFGDGPTTIGSGAFNACKVLTDVTFGDGEISIGRQAFMNCSSLPAVTFGDGETSIGYQAFMNCSSLSAVTFGHGETNIVGSEVFSGCSNLTSVTIPESVQHIQSAHFKNTGLKTIYFLGCPQTINYDAFSGVTATAIYPADDPNWTEDKRKNYGGNLTWLPCEHDFEGSSCDTLESCYNCGATWYGHSRQKATCTSPETCTNCGRTFGSVLEHIYKNGICQNCGSYRPGDLDRNGRVTDADAKYLLWHTLFPELYPLQAEADFSGDGAVTDQDAVILLWHALFPYTHPLG